LLVQRSIMESTVLLGLIVSTAQPYPGDNLWVSGISPIHERRFMPLNDTARTMLHGVFFRRTPRDPLPFFMTAIFMFIRGLYAC
jgi:hypothetical protein